MLKKIMFALGLLLSTAVLADEAKSPPAVATAQNGETLTLESFAAAPLIASPSLSPNGRYMATKLSTGGVQMLAMMPLFGGTEKPVLLSLDLEKLSVDWWDWVNDDWLLFGVSATQSVEGNKWRLSRVMSMQRSTGKVNQIGWKDAGQIASDVVWMARDGSPRILLGVQNSIYTNYLEFWPEVREFDVSTGKSKAVVQRRENVTRYYADASGTVRLGYGYIPTNRTARLLYRNGPKESFKELDRANLRKGEELSTPRLFLAQPGKALTVDDPDGYDSVYELDLATLTRGAKIFGLNGYDIDGLIPNVTGDALAGVRLTENRSRIHWFDPGLAETQAQFDKAVGESHAEIVSWDRTGQKLLVHVGAANQAGAYFYYDREAGGALKRIGYVDGTLKQRKLAPVSTIRYKARDGMEISGVLTLPTGRAAKVLPLILLPHGGPQARDSEGWDWIAQFLAWRGYAVIQPNFRGSSGFGKAFLEAGEGEWGLKMQDDLNDAVSHLATQGIADPKRVCVLGASYGGYAAMRAAQRDGGRFRCVISYAGVSDLAGMSRYDGRFLYGREFRSQLKEHAPDYDSVSPLRFPDQFSTPILLMHGKLDLTVPVEQSRYLAAKLKAAGKTYRYVEQPLADHFFSRSADRLQFLQEIDAFLRQYNPAD